MGNIGILWYKSIGDEIEGMVVMHISICITLHGIAPITQALYCHHVELLS